MRNKMYEVVFEATETLQNGKERRCKKSVFMPVFDENGKHISREMQIARGEAALREAYFYNIEYHGTKTTMLIFG